MIKSALNAYDGLEVYDKGNNNEFENFSNVFNRIENFEKSNLCEVSKELGIHIKLLFNEVEDCKSSKKPMFLLTDNSGNLLHLPNLLIEKIV